MNIPPITLGPTHTEYLRNEGKSVGMFRVSADGFKARAAAKELEQLLNTDKALIEEVESADYECSDIRNQLARGRERMKSQRIADALSWYAKEALVYVVVFLPLIGSIIGLAVTCFRG